MSFTVLQLFLRPSEFFFVLKVAQFYLISLLLIFTILSI